MSANTSRERPIPSETGSQFVGRRLLLVAGFLSITAAVGIAHDTPASGYELSIYAGTPTAFWLAVGAALACALVVAFFPPSPLTRVFGLFLGGLAVLTVAGIPLLRGYAFYGTGDPLTHVGWVRNVLAGELTLGSLIYPGLHSVTIFVHQVLGLTVEHAMLLASLLFVASFLLFLPLFVYALTDNLDIAAVGLFSALMLLPVNNISTHLLAFPSTMAIFFAPLALLLALVYLTERDERTWFTPLGWLLGLASVAVVLVHPQQASNLLLVVATVTVVLGVRQRYFDTSRPLRPPYVQTAFFAVVLVVWGSLHERITEAATSYSGSVVTTLFGGGTAGASTIAQRSGSLADIGVTPLELGLKLFLVSGVYLLLTALLLGSDLTGRFERFSPRLDTLSAFGLALVPVGGVMVLYMLGKLQSIYFRHFGFIMVLATVFGAVVIGRVVSRLRASDRSHRVATGLVAAIVAGLLVLSLATAFGSPFIYKASSHITDQQFEGHETAFAYESEEVSYVGIRTGPDRYRDAVLGVLDLEPRSERRANRIPFQSLDSDLTSQFVGPRYLVVTDADVQRETVAFQNLRYSERGFRTLGHGTGVDRVVTNGGFRLYHIDDD